MVSTIFSKSHDREQKMQEKAASRSHSNSDNAALPRNRQDILNGTRGGRGDRGDMPRPGLIRVRTAGESGRTGFHPAHFLRIVWRSASWLSRAVNVLWPIVPAAIVVCFAVKDRHELKFALAYLGIIPCANLIGFAGQELARKMPHMLGVLVETTISSIVEIVLFIILLTQDQYVVIQHAILGSILATMLLCLGLCFIASGIRREDSEFNEAISEAGSGLLLTAGLALAVPAIFETALSGRLGDAGIETEPDLEKKVLDISHGVAVLLLVTYVVFIVFQTRTHHGIFNAIFEHDEERDHDQHKDAIKAKLTLLECILALIISVGLVTVLAYCLVHEIHYIVDGHAISEPFMGLILVPLVEKAAEQLTAIDEAWDNQMNFALSHCIGTTLQTAMLNAPLVVIVGWGLGKEGMSLNFEIFDMAMLLLAIITVGNFLRDQKSNYLEGVLCVMVYVAIALAAWFYPNPAEKGVKAEGAH